MPKKENEKLRIAMLGHKRFPSREGGVEIVVEPCLLLEEAADHRGDRGPLGRGLINDRRAVPFKERGIGAVEQPKGLLQVPAVDVQGIVQLPFDHIPGLLQPQIMLQGADIDESDIVVTVRRGEAPGPAPGFDAVDDLNVLPALDRLQLRGDDLIDKSVMFRHRCDLLLFDGDIIAEKGEMVQ